MEHPEKPDDGIFNEGVLWLFNSLGRHECPQFFCGDLNACHCGGPCREALRFVDQVHRHAGIRVLEVVPWLESQVEAPGGSLVGPIIDRGDVAVVYGEAELPFIGDIVSRP